MSDSPNNSGRSAVSNQLPRVNPNPRTKAILSPTEPETVHQTKNTVEQPSTMNLKQCWICLATEEDDSHAIWAQPCICRGTTKWVHQACLQQWVAEKQKDTGDKNVACPVCKTQYLYLIPQANILVVVLDTADAIIYKMSPLVVSVIYLGSLYWSAATHGAITVIEVAGETEGIELMERMPPAVLLAALPIIPMSLIVLNTFHWEDSLLNFLRKASPSWPVLKYFLPAPIRNESGIITENPVNEFMQYTRGFAGALLFPKIATLCGNMFFHHVESRIKRFFVGGIAFIAIKGIFKMYSRHKKDKVSSTTIILDYTEENRGIHGGSTNSSS